MKKQVRNNLFETNSSSVHTITISKSNSIAILDKLHFEGGEFGWDVCEYRSPAVKASYLYTALAYDKNTRDEKMKEIVEILERHGCSTTYDEFVDDGWYENGYIDHAEDLYDFLNIVLKSEKNLLNYLFGDSVLYTYNDNMSYSDSTFFEHIMSLNTDKYYIITKGN